MLYLKNFSFLPKEREEDFFIALKRTCYSTAYPFDIFPQKGLTHLEFEPVTILSGGNGSGKTTALNIMAQALEAKRTSPYNSSAFFEEYVNMCSFELDPRAGEELFTEWLKERSPDAKPLRVRSMDDYAELVQQNKRRRMTQSAYVRSSLMNNVRAHSNGESALLFFTDKIDENSLYLVDEPENSLSTESQKKLAEYIENAARFYNCQFIISSHSPFMLSLKGAKVYDMDAFPVHPVHWTDMANIRALYEFFMQHRDEFANYER